MSVNVEDRPKKPWEGSEKPERAPVIIPEGAPIVVSDYVMGPWYIRPVDEEDGELGTLVGPLGGWEHPQEAVDWLMQCGLKDRGGKGDFEWAKPWLGYRFEIIPLRSQSDFIRFCSW
jgi:hypothetical protein